MRYYLATIQLLIEVDSQAEAEDAVAEGMRPLLQEFEPESCWIDWQYFLGWHPIPHDGTGFEYAKEQSRDQS